MSEILEFLDWLPTPAVICVFIGAMALAYLVWGAIERWEK